MFASSQKFVDEVMALVEIGILKDAVVGLPGVSGLSTEQRKRLTIAVELVANPSIIFMDEPTSGLDARAAAIVMRAVRNTVDTGRTVVCTIHQPSIDIFESFDEVNVGTHAFSFMSYLDYPSQSIEFPVICIPSLSYLSKSILHQQLLLMKRGGEVIYSGPLGRNSRGIIEYFEVCSW